MYVCIYKDMYIADCTQTLIASPEMTSNDTSLRLLRANHMYMCVCVCVCLSVCLSVLCVCLSYVSV